MIQNMRDLNEIRTTAGKTIKKGCLIRSANLAQAELSDLEGISAIIDLRTNGERCEQPDRTFDRQYLELPVFEEITAGISHEEGAENNGVPDMRNLYKWLVKECRDSLKTILTAIMEHDYSSGAILWHCSEGKDRCGITTALVLEMLGADRTAIMEDYLKTNEINLPKAESIREMLKADRGEAFAESVYRAYIADRSYLEAAWEAMGEDYIDRLGISKEQIAGFKRKVLE